MYWFRFAVLIVVVTVLQASFVDAVTISLRDIKPDLLLICLVFFALYSNTYDAILASFIIGFASDISISAASRFMGPGIISFGITGTLLAYLRSVVTINKMPYQSLAIFAAGFIAAIICHLLSLIKSPSTSVSMYVLMFGSPLYSAVIGPFLFLPFAWWMRIKTQRFGR
jgi:rod shape-determining protein MreD